MRFIIKKAACSKEKKAKNLNSEDAWITQFTGHIKW